MLSLPQILNLNLAEYNNIPEIRKNASIKDIGSHFKIARILDKTITVRPTIVFLRISFLADDMQLFYIYQRIMYL